MHVYVCYLYWCCLYFYMFVWFCVCDVCVFAPACALDVLCISVYMMCVWLCLCVSGESGGGHAPAAAEGGTVCSDPWPEHPAPPHLWLHPWTEEEAPWAGDQRQGALRGDQPDDCQNQTAGAGTVMQEHLTYWKGYDIIAMSTLTCARPHLHKSYRHSNTNRPSELFSAQMHLRFEMEMERMKQIHQKELEDKDEELEDVQKSSQRRVRDAEWITARQTTLQPCLKHPFLSASVCVCVFVCSSDSWRCNWNRNMRKNRWWFMRSMT